LWYGLSLHSAQSIELEQRITRRLAATEVHWYRIFLDQGGYARVLVEQKGIDVEILLFDPLGRELSETDGFEYGTESASLHAASSGAYKIEIRPAQRQGPPGDYVLRVIKLEMGARGIEERAAAERISTEAKHLEFAGTPEALRLSLEKATQALSLWRGLHEDAPVLRTLILLSELCYSMNRTEGLGYIAEALSLSQALGDTRSEGEAYNDKGMIEWQEDQPEAALSDLNQAMILWKAIDYHYGQAAALSNQGILLTQLGEHQEALQSYFQALRLIRSLKDVKGEAFITNNIGAAYRWLGNYHNAVDYLARAVRLFHLEGDTVAAARATLTLARVDLDLGHSAAAAHRAHVALSIIKSAADHQWEADSWYVLAQAYQQQGDLARALQCISQSLAESKAVGYIRGEANALYSSGLIQSSLGDHDDSVRLLLEALKLERKIHLPDREADTLGALAKEESNRGNLTQAADWAKSALTVTESLRSNVPGDEFRAFFLATKLRLYSLYIDILMRLHEQRPTAGFNAEAFETSERARSRSLLDMLREGHGEIRRGIPPALSLRERTIQRGLNFESLRLMRAINRHEPASEREARQRLDRMIDEYQEVEAQIRAESPSYADITQPVKLNLAQVQIRVLTDKDTLLLEYQLGDDQSYGWAVTGQSIFSWTIPRRSTVEQVAKSMDGLIRKPHLDENERQRLERDERALSRMLLGPVMHELRGKRLLVVGDGILQSLPFGALPTPEKHDNSNSIPLIAEHEIVMLPSASTIAVLRQELDGMPSAPRMLAVLADPVFDRQDERVQGAHAAAAPNAIPDIGSTFRRLLFSREEARDISALVPPASRMIALDFAACKKLMMSGTLGQYRIVHISTHGMLDQVHPELSALVFSLVNSRGASQDGLLRLHEVYNLKLPADLVVLSACDTFLGGNIRGEGLVGLARGFMYAGTKSVVASLWSADDESTAELMRRFYKNMLGSEMMLPAAALRAAQASMWREGRWSPYNWAGFVIEGEWRSVGK